MMPKKAFLISVFVFLAVIIGYAGTASSAHPVVSRVNEDNKDLKGTWVHRIKTPGQDLYSVITRVNVDIKGKSFYLSQEGGDLDFIFDGSALWEVLPIMKEAHRVNTNGAGEMMPFWKMDPSAGPLLLLNFVGEEVVAGRQSKVFRIPGEFRQGAVYVTYWIDKEKDVLLKKEYVLFIGKRLVVRESYECEKVEFGKGSAPAPFNVNIPSDWTRTGITRLRYDLLKTKF